MPLPPPRTLTTRAGRPLSFSAFGFGSAPLGNMHRVLDEDEAHATVQSAWSLGARYFDTAPLYGHGLAELRIGATLAGLDRSRFLLSTKVGRLLEPCAPGDEDSGIFQATPHRRVVYDYSYDGVMRSFEASLDRLGLERIDILLVHDIDAETHGSAEQSEAHLRNLLGGGWRALDELRSAGAIDAIGAGLNEWPLCERLLGLVDPDLFLLAGRYTLLEQTALDSFLPACATRGVGVVVGGPFNSGVLATGPVAGAMYNYALAPSWVLDRAKALQTACRLHGVSLAQAALQFPLGHPAVVSVIPGGQTPAEVERNAAMLAEPVPENLWSDLKLAGLIRADALTPAEGITAC
jgi:D-threo-aldose 1-dehydrogenase